MVNLFQTASLDQPVLKWLDSALHFKPVIGILKFIVATDGWGIT